jgi:hypothetical protein
MPEARVIPIEGRDGGTAAPRRGRRTERCEAVGTDGQRCKAKAVTDGLCGSHLEQHERAAAQAAAPEWERKLAGALAFMRRRVTGDYPIDDFGFDSASRHAGSTTSRTRAARWSLPTIPAPCRSTR